MNELALYAGAGGGLLGSRLLGFRAVCYVENDPYCVSVLKARIADGYLDDAPIWDDARTFDGRPWAGLVDVVTAGFPCQPFSVAGRRKGEEDERNLWPDTIRIIREVGPRYCLLENVPGLLAHDYFGTILGELAASGFDAEWGVLSAAAVGAPHLRKRLWIVAYARGAGGREDARRALGNEASHGPEDSYIADGDGEGGGARDVADASEQSNGRCRQSREDARRVSWWAVEPRLGRVAHGVANRLDRLRALGNGQVPAVVAEAWWRLMERCTSGG